MGSEEELEALKKALAEKHETLEALKNRTKQYVAEQKVKFAALEEELQKARKQIDENGVNPGKNPEASSTEDYEALKQKAAAAEAQLAALKERTRAYVDGQKARAAAQETRLAEAQQTIAALQAQAAAAAAGGGQGGREQAEELAAAREAEGRAEAECLQLRRRLGSLEAQSQGWLREKEALEGAAARAQAEWEGMASQVEGLRARLEGQEEGAAAGRAAAEELGRLEAQHAREVQDLKKALAQAQESQQSLAQELSAAQEAKSGLEAQSQGWLREKEALEGAAARAQAEWEGMASQVEGLRARLEGQEGAAGRAAAELEQLRAASEQQAAAAQAQVSALEQQLRAAQEQAAAARGEAEAAQEQLAALQQQVEGGAGSQEILQGELDKAKEELAAAKEHAVAVERELGSSRDEVTGLTGQVVTALDTLSRVCALAGVKGDADTVAVVGRIEDLVVGEVRAAREAQDFNEALAQAEASRESIAQELSVAAEENETLKNEALRLKHRIEELSQAQGDSSEEVAGLRQMEVSCKGEIQRLRQELEILRDKALPGNKSAENVNILSSPKKANTQPHNDSSSESPGTLRRQLNEAAVLGQELLDRKSGLEDKVSAFEAVREALEQENEDLKCQLDAFKQLVGELETRCKELSDSEEIYEPADLSELVPRLKPSTPALVRARREASGAVEEAEAARKRCLQLEETITKLQEQYEESELEKSAMSRKVIDLECSMRAQAGTPGGLAVDNSAGDTGNQSFLSDVTTPQRPLFPAANSPTQDLLMMGGDSPDQHSGAKAEEGQEGKSNALGNVQQAPTDAGNANFDPFGSHQTDHPGADSLVSLPGLVSHQGGVDLLGAFSNAEDPPLPASRQVFGQERSELTAQYEATIAKKDQELQSLREALQAEKANVHTAMQGAGENASLRSSEIETDGVSTPPETLHRTRFGFSPKQDSSRKASAASTVTSPAPDPDSARFGFKPGSSSPRSQTMSEQRQTQKEDDDADAGAAASAMVSALAAQLAELNAVQEETRRAFGEERAALAARVAELEGAQSTAAEALAKAEAAYQERLGALVAAAEAANTAAPAKTTASPAQEDAQREEVAWEQRAAQAEEALSTARLEYEGELAALRGKLDDLRARESELYAEVEHREQAADEDLHANRLEYEGRIEDLTRQLSEKKEELQALQFQLDELANSYSENQGQSLEAMREKYEKDAEEKCGKLSQEHTVVLSSLEAEHEAAKLDLEMQITELSKEIMLLKPSNEDLARQLSEKKEELQALQSQLDELADSSSENKEQSLEAMRVKHEKDVEEKCGKLSQEHTEVLSSLKAEHEAAKLDLEAQVDELSKEIMLLTTSSEELKQEVISANERHEQDKNAVALVEGTVQDLQAALEAKDQELKQRMSEAKAAFQTQKKRIEELKAERDDLQHRFDSLEAHANDLKVANEAVETRCAELLKVTESIADNQEQDEVMKRTLEERLSELECAKKAADEEKEKLLQQTEHVAKSLQSRDAYIEELEAAKARALAERAAESAEHERELGLLVNQQAEVVEGKEAEVNALTDSLQNEQSTVRNLKTTLEERDAQLAQARIDFEEMKKLKAMFEGRVTSMEKEIQTRFRDTQFSDQEQRDTIISLESNVSSLQAQIQENNQAHSTAQNQLIRQHAMAQKQLNEQITSLQKSLDNEKQQGEDRKKKVKAYVESLQKEKNEMGIRIDHMSQQMLQLQTTAELKSQEVTQILQQKDQATALLASQIQALQASITQGEQKQKELASILKTKEDKIEALMSQGAASLGAARGEAEEHRAKRLRARREMVELAGELEAEREVFSAINALLDNEVIPKVVEHAAALERVVFEVGRAMGALARRQRRPVSGVAGLVAGGRHDPYRDNLALLEAHPPEGAGGGEAGGGGGEPYGGLLEGAAEASSGANKSLEARRLAKCRELQAELRRLGAGVRLAAQGVEQMRGTLEDTKEENICSSLTYLFSRSPLAQQVPARRPGVRRAGYGRVGGGARPADADAVSRRGSDAAREGAAAAAAAAPGMMRSSGTNGGGLGPN